MKLSRLPTDFSPVFFCPGCNARFSERAEAVACSGSNETCDVIPGDILEIDIGYSWHDGADNWMIFNTGDWHGAKTHSAYFIVTALTWEDHRVHIHVKTLGIKNGSKTGLTGWTGKGHIPWKKVDRPDLYAEASQYIGSVTDHLL